MIRLVPATSDAVRKVFHGTPPRTMRGIVFEEDGEPIGVAGLYLDAAGVQVMFFDGDHKATGKYLKEVVLAGRELLGLAKRTGVPVISKADENIPGSERLLEFLGFKPIEGGIYQWRE